MLPLIVFVVVTVAARLVGWATGVDWLDAWTPALASGLAVMFALMSTAHFLPRRRGQLVQMVPPRLAHAELLVTVTGVLEVAGAVGLLIPMTSRLAGVCLALLLVAMFPANVHAARARTGIRTMPLPARALVQAAFIAACLVVAFAPGS